MPRPGLLPARWSLRGRRLIVLGSAGERSVCRRRTAAATRGSWRMKVSGCLRAVPRGVSAASLQPRLARSYTQTLLSAATAGAIQAIAEETSPSPGSRTTVGLPEPVQCRGARWPPTSMSWPGMGRRSRRSTPVRSRSRRPTRRGSGRAGRTVQPCQATCGLHFSHGWSEGHGLTA